MAHYAFLDESNIVTEVILGIDENELIEGLAPEEWYAKFRGQKCVRTSYNATIRANFAGVGFKYDYDFDFDYVKIITMNKITIIIMIMLMNRLRLLL